MPLNSTLPNYYVDGFCNLIGKAPDGSYDLGSAQSLSADECLTAQHDWEKFVKDYGGKYGIKQDGSGTNNSQDPGMGISSKRGGSFFDFNGGLFSWIGLGLIGDGNENGGGPGFNMKDLLIIAGIALLAIFLLRK